MQMSRDRIANALTVFKMRTYTPRVPDFRDAAEGDFYAQTANKVQAGRLAGGVDGDGWICFWLFACRQCCGAGAAEISGRCKLAARIAQQLDHGPGGRY